MLCHRPAVLVGGELTIDMLELQLNPVAKYYTAPAQMKANNGVLIIDDFGRQRIRPEELLNRWVVPLDRRIDFLTLAGGRKVEIPFEMFVVFATNLDPATLVDAAFLRRIQTKVHVGAITNQEFHEIFRGVCKPLELECEPNVIDELIDVIKNKLHEPLASLPSARHRESDSLGGALRTERDQVESGGRVLSGGSLLRYDDRGN